LRRLGSEAGGLFRWARVTPEQLLQVLDANFAGLYEFTGLTPAYLDMVQDGRYGIGWHTEMRSSDAEGSWQFLADEAARRKIHAKEIRKIRHLIAKLVARAKMGGAIFVIKSNDGIATATLRALHAALTRIAEGAAFTLLEMREATDPAQIGTVQQREPFWLSGYVARFAPYSQADDIDFSAWTKILGEACRLAPCADWPARLARFSVPEPKIELRFPLEPSLNLTPTLSGPQRAVLINGNSLCRPVNDAFRLHGGALGEAGTILRWSGVVTPGAAQLCAMLQLPVDDSAPVVVTAKIRDAHGRLLALWRGRVAPNAPEELGADFTPTEPGPLTIEFIAHASRALREGERAVVDIAAPTLYLDPITANTAELLQTR